MHLIKKCAKNSKYCEHAPFTRMDMVSRMCERLSIIELFFCYSKRTNLGLTERSTEMF